MNINIKHVLRGYPTTSISGNNVRKYFLENDYLVVKVK